MSQPQVVNLLDDQPSDRQPGDLDEHEDWWVERQEALEASGYMLRPRYRPGWIPSWRGTNKFPLDLEDGQRVLVSPVYAFWLYVFKDFFRCAWVWTQLEFLMGDLLC